MKRIFLAGEKIKKLITKLNSIKTWAETFKEKENDTAALDNTNEYPQFLKMNI